jgi:sugar/nucleoside kinase (ribokinase family)
MNQFDFVAIGDIVTDAFIRIQDASVNCDIDKEKCQLCFRFGDKVPFESVTIVPAVGNSPNAATAAARLGLSSALIADIGDDYFGKECVDALKKNGVSGDFIRTHAGMKTNYHYVLWFNDERTILVKHEEYDYGNVPDIGEPKWIYLSSMGANSLPYHMRIAEYLDKHPNVQLAFQPGTFQMKLGKEKLSQFYARSHVFICNIAESQKILGTNERDIKKLLSSMAALGPKITLITDGPKGAYAYDGNEYWFMPAYPDPKPPYERTGAGDAFSSTFVSALALGKSVEEALMWAPINSMSVVQKIGAQEGLLTRAELEKFLMEAPADYKPKKI